MNKVSGKKSDFAYVREDSSRIVIGYGLKKVTGQNLYEWYEIYIYKTQISQLTLKVVKDSIWDDINARTDEAILCGMDWTIQHGTDEGKEIKVWLSKENQENYKAKHDAAIQYPELVTFPMKYKVGEDEEGNAVYENFQNINELAQFYLAGLSYIEQCYNAGWTEKDSIDWTPYEALFPQTETANAEE